MAAGVSAFIIGTCQLRPKSYCDVFYSMQFHMMSPSKELRHNFVSGSSVEFFIDPFNSCVEDKDILIGNADLIAFSYGTPVIPDDIRGLLDHMNCSEMVPYPNYPGFVRLQSIGKMIYNWHCRRFEFQAAERPYRCTRIPGTRPVYNYSSEQMSKEGRYCSGPAVKIVNQCGLFSDIVGCIWCPQWPEEAKNWPYRQRKYGWPTIASIHEVVRNGCHVVNARHPNCRDDVLQCRLSFSAAEVILLQSLTPVQQIVYHMLRFFAKRELIRKDCPKEDEVLCTYHFKTLMLWSCEEMPPEWWNSSSVIELGCLLLRKLSEWLQKKYFPNYFIPQANLLHERTNEKAVYEIITRLKRFCLSSNLTEWFAVKYVMPVLKRVSISTEIIYPLMDIDNSIVLRVCEIMGAGKLVFFDWRFSIGFYLCAQYAVQDVVQLTTYAFRIYLQKLNGAIKIMEKAIDMGSFLSTSAVEFQSSFSEFAKVILILHAASALRFQQFSWDCDIFTEFVREVLWQPRTVRSKYHDFPKRRNSSQDRSLDLFLNAQRLSETLTGTNSRLEFNLVSQVLIGLLRQALVCEDSTSDAIASAGCIYVAALHFAQSDYETALDLCSRILQKHTLQDEVETLNAGCLLYIDDIARIVGFHFLFRRIQLNQQYTKMPVLLDLRLTPQVVSQYLLVSSYERRPFGGSLPTCSYDLQMPTFLLDKLLFCVSNRRYCPKTENVYNKTDLIDATEPSIKKPYFLNEDELVCTLEEYALENMASFYNAICKDFDIHLNTVDCYRAAFLYKCGKYPEVLQLCHQILAEPDLHGRMKDFAFANVIVLPPLDAFFDRDVQCLLGIYTLVYYFSPKNEFLPIPEGSMESTIDHFFARTVFTDCYLPAAILDYDYAMKCHYFLGRHFLARYLKVRCLVDCHRSDSEVISAFKTLKSQLPFEHILRCLLRQKLRLLVDGIN